MQHNVHYQTLERGWEEGYGTLGKATPSLWSQPVRFAMLGFMKRLIETAVFATALATSILALSSCRSLTQGSIPQDPGTPVQESRNRAAELAAYPPPKLILDLEIAREPFAEVPVNWKERGNQPYLYVDHFGDYRLAGARIVEVFERLAEAEIPQDGPPFILFYDDPAETPTDKLRARVAIPVGSRINPVPAGLLFDILPGTVVVYGFIGGPYSEVPRAYPALFNYIREMGWTLNGPIRESYLISPASVQNFEDLVTELQIPATQSR